MKRMIEDSVLTGIADAIREKNGTENTYKPSEMPQGVESVYSKGYSEGYEQGKVEATKEEQEKSITITENGTYEVNPDENKVLSRVTVEVDVENQDFEKYATKMEFKNIEFPNDYELTLSFENCAEFAFAGSTGLKKLKIIGNVPNVAVDMVSTFLRCSSLEEIDFSEYTLNVKRLLETFYSCTLLERILGEFDFTNCYNANNAFVNCYNLKTFTPKKETIKTSISFVSSPALTDESIDAIVNGFADMTGQTAPVLAVHANVKARIVADDLKEETDPTKRYWLRTLTSKNVTLA